MHVCPFEIEVTPFLTMRVGDGTFERKKTHFVVEAITLFAVGLKHFSSFSCRALNQSIYASLFDTYQNG